VGIASAALSETGRALRLFRSLRGIPPGPLLALLIGSVLTCAYAWVLDDAFVYFRYADNAALLGAGLVYNHGEYVEGYTSPLWMLLLVGIRALHLRYWPVILTVGVTGMLATWSLAVRVNRRLSRDAPLEVHVPAMWIASSYAVESHFTSGLETPLVQIEALLFVALVLEPEVRWLQVLVAVGPLIRPELNLAFIVAVIWTSYRHRRVPWVFLSVGLLTQAAWLCFRVYYYADLVPNTFHIKDGAAVARGLYYLQDTLRAYHLYWILGGSAAILGLSAWRHGRESLMLAPRAVLWLTAALHTAYVVRIGGDFVHYRYLAFPLLVMVGSLGGVAERLLGPSSSSQGHARRWLVVVLGVSFVGLTVLSYPGAQLPSHPLLLPHEENTLAKYRVNTVEDAASHRGRVDLRPADWDKGAEDIIRRFRHRTFPYRWVAETGWCRAGYEHPDWFIVQSFGLTDPVLAHVIDPERSTHAGHRWGVLPLARDLVRIRLRALQREQPSFATPSPDPESVYGAAARRHEAPAWMERNLGALEVIEERTRGKREWRRSVIAALHPWPRMIVRPADVRAASL
jgi:hypothetical protein